MTSQLNVALIRNLRGPWMYLAYTLKRYPWVFYNLAQEDARSTGAWIKCLHCTRLKTAGQI